MAVQYTPGQLREILGISPETYRHWKKALPSLRRERGHSPSFSTGDLLATEVIRTLSIDLSIRVGALTQVASGIFEQCNHMPWPTLERGAFSLNLLEANLLFREERTFSASAEPIVWVPLQPLIARLRARLLPTNDNGRQDSLRFPLTPVGRTARSVLGVRT